MKKNLLRLPLLGLLLLVSSYLPAQLAQEDVVYVIYGNQGATTPVPDRLAILDETDGSLTEIGIIRDEVTGDPVTGIASLAVNSAGELYGLGQNFATNPNPVLVQINPATAEARVIGQYAAPTPPNTPAITSIKGIVFANRDQLLGIDWRREGEDVFEIDITDASLTVLFDNALPQRWYGGAEYNPADGLVYLSSWSAGNVLTLDPNTGAVNTVFAADAHPGDSAGDIFIGSDGEFYITSGRRGNGPNLWQVDLDGAPQTSTNVTPTGMTQGVRAATLTTIVVPREPEEPEEPEDLPAMPSSAKLLLILGLVSISSLLIYKSKFSL